MVFNNRSIGHADNNDDGDGGDSDGGDDRNQRSLGPPARRAGACQDLTLQPRVLSHIHPLLLHENVGGGRGKYATVSILDPVMRIERSGTRGGPKDPYRPVYRITAGFVMQFTINRTGEEVTRHNRIFDSVNIRYLYRSGERHDVLPKGDSVASNIRVTNEDGDTQDLKFGINATGGSGQPSPNFTVHTQHASRMTYDRNLRSWRRALTFETYPPVREAKTRALLPFLPRQPASPTPETPGFHVASPHAERCSCRRPRRCRLRAGALYDRAAHWSGQTEAQLHLWTPEIYEGMSCPITITREVDADRVDRILALSHEQHVQEGGGEEEEEEEEKQATDRDNGYYQGRYSDHDSYGVEKRRPDAYYDGLEELRRHLHFDFDVEVRTRELGRGIRGLFSSAAEPPEVRARRDAGRPMPADRSQFCVASCVEKISWPQYETRNLQGEAEEQISKFGFCSRLKSSQEYESANNAVAPPNLGPQQQQKIPGRGRMQNIQVSSISPSSQLAPLTPARRRVAFSPDGRLRTFGRPFEPWDPPVWWAGEQTGNDRRRPASPPPPPTASTPPHLIAVAQGQGRVGWAADVQVRTAAAPGYRQDEHGLGYFRRPTVELAVHRGVGGRGDTEATVTQGRHTESVGVVGGGGGRDWDDDRGGGVDMVEWTADGDRQEAAGTGPGRLAGSPAVSPPPPPPPPPPSPSQTRTLGRQEKDERGYESAQESPVCSTPPISSQSRALRRMRRNSDGIVGGLVKLKRF